MENPGFPQINILPARMRKHRREFSVRERRRNRQQPGNNPRLSQQPSRAPHFPRHSPLPQERSRSRIMDPATIIVESYSPEALWLSSSFVSVPVTISEA